MASAAQHDRQQYGQVSVRAAMQNLSLRTALHYLNNTMRIERSIGVDKDPTDILSGLFRYL